MYHHSTESTQHPTDFPEKLNVDIHQIQSDIAFLKRILEDNYTKMNLILTLLQDIERRLPSPQPEESSNALKTDTADGVDDKDDDSDVAYIPEPVCGLTNS